MYLEIVVIGMGYVGIPTAAMFANVEGFTVTGVQRRSKRSGWKIDYLNAGKCPIGGDEPGLAELIEKVGEAEWRADKSQMIISRELFKMEKELDPVSILIIDKIIVRMGKVANNAETCADMMRNLLTKGDK